MAYQTSAECRGCGKAFAPVWNKNLKRWSFYCTRTCYGESRTSLSNAARTITCEGCGKSHFASIGVKGKPRRFCSPACYQAHHVGKKNARWTGRFYQPPQSPYVHVKLTRPESRRHTCTAKHRGLLPRHKFVAETVLGRCLKRDEVVHHINGDQQDDRSSNLLVCSTAYHQWLHGEMSRRYQREHFGGR